MELIFASNVNLDENENEKYICHPFLMAFQNR